MITAISGRHPLFLKFQQLTKISHRKTFVRLLFVIIGKDEKRDRNGAKTRKETQNKNNKTAREINAGRRRPALCLVFDIWLFHLGFRNLDCQRVSDRWRKHVPILSVALAAYGVWLAIKTTDARFKSIRRVIGCVLVYFGLLIILHAQIFSNVVGEQANIFQTTWMTLLGDIRRSQVTQNVGGGMIGAMLYGATYFLVSQIGSYIIAVLLMMIGAFLFSQMSSHELVEHLQAAGDKLQRLLEGSPEKQAERSPQSGTSSRETSCERSQKEAERAAVMAEIKEKNQVRPMTEDEKSAKEQQMQAPADFEPEQLSFVPIDHFQELPQAAGPEAAQAPHPAGNKPGPSKRSMKTERSLMMMVKYWNLRFRKKLKIVIMNCLQRNYSIRSLQRIKAASTKDRTKYRCVRNHLPKLRC